MKNYLISSSIVLVVMLAGCQNQTPVQQLTALDNTASLTETALVILDQNHVIPAADRPAVAAAIKLVNADLAAANANVNLPIITSLLAQLQADLNALIALKVKYPAIQSTTQGS